MRLDEVQLGGLRCDEEEEERLAAEKRLDELPL